MSEMSESLHELDVCSLPPPQRHPEIFHTFDSLKAGEAFILINDHAPKPLLYQFQMERPATFEWNVLEAGPDRFRVEIRRRNVNGTRNVSEYLGEDHRRLDTIVTEVDCLLGANAYPEAGKKFDEFACGLNRHIVAEEEILFPTFEQLTGMASGPTAVMREEHVEIRRLLGEVSAAIRDKNAAGALESIRTIVSVLSGHNRKEEGILYPMTDRAAGGDRERDELVRRLQAV